MIRFNPLLTDVSWIASWSSRRALTESMSSSPMTCKADIVLLRWALLSDGVYQQFHESADLIGRAIPVFRTYWMHRGSGNLRPVQQHLPRHYEHFPRHEDDQKPVFPRSCAQRPLPSMIMAMCASSRPLSIFLKNSSVLGLLHRARPISSARKSTEKVRVWGVCKLTGRKGWIFGTYDHIKRAWRPCSHSLNPLYRFPAVWRMKVQLPGKYPKPC